MMMIMHLHFRQIVELSSGIFFCARYSSPGVVCRYGAGNGHKAELEGRVVGPGSGRRQEVKG